MDVRQVSDVVMLGWMQRGRDKTEMPYMAYMYCLQPFEDLASIPQLTNTFILCIRPNHTHASGKAGERVRGIKENFILHKSCSSLPAAKKYSLLLVMGHFTATIHTYASLSIHLVDGLKFQLHAPRKVRNG